MLPLCIPAQSPCQPRCSRVSGSTCVDSPDALRRALDLSDNYLTSLAGVTFPSALVMDFANNQITSLDGVRFPQSLK